MDRAEGPAKCWRDSGGVEEGLERQEGAVGRGYSQEEETTKGSLVGNKEETKEGTDPGFKVPAQE